MNKSLPSDKLIKSAQLLLWMANWQHSRETLQLLLCCLPSPPLWKQWPWGLRLFLSTFEDIVPFLTWYFITRSDVCYTDMSLLSPPETILAAITSVDIFLRKTSTQFCVTVCLFINHSQWAIKKSFHYWYCGNQFLSSPYSHKFKELLDVENYC